MMLVLFQKNVRSFFSIAAHVLNSRMGMTRIDPNVSIHCTQFGICFRSDLAFLYDPLMTAGNPSPKDTRHLNEPGRKHPMIGTSLRIPLHHKAIYFAYYMPPETPRWVPV